MLAECWYLANIILRYEINTFTLTCNQEHKFYCVKLFTINYGEKTEQEKAASSLYPWQNLPHQTLRMARPQSRFCLLLKKRKIFHIFREKRKTRKSVDPNLSLSLRKKKTVVNCRHRYVTVNKTSTTGIASFCEFKVACSSFFLRQKG